MPAEIISKPRSATTRRRCANSARACSESLQIPVFSSIWVAKISVLTHPFKSVPTASITSSAADVSRRAPSTRSSSSSTPIESGGELPKRCSRVFFSAVVIGLATTRSGQFPSMTESREDLPPDAQDPTDREEEEAAATEAARIGGRSGMEEMDEAERATAEHGGGESEGFEEAEELLEGQATHGDPGTDPLGVLSEPEQEPDPAVYGEADGVDSTEIDEGSTP